MIICSFYVNPLLGEDEDQEPDVPRLTIMFTLLYFLAATQDIAVDGWALTMLKPINVGLAATCNQAEFATPELELFYAKCQNQMTHRAKRIICCAGYSWHKGGLYK